MSKPVSGVRRVTEFSRFSEIPNSQREECLRACREMTDSIYEGLDASVRTSRFVSCLASELSLVQSKPPMLAAASFFAENVHPSANENIAGREAARWRQRCQGSRRRLR